MRTLITGVAGFVGRHLANELSQDPDEELNGADHVALGDEEILHCHLKSHRPLDVTNFEQVRGCVLESKPDRIVHLAAQSSGSESIHKPAETFRVNALGALNVVEVARTEARDAVILLVGSADIYGTGAPGRSSKCGPTVRQASHRLSPALARLAASMPSGMGTSMASAKGTRIRSLRAPPQSPPAVPKPYAENCGTAVQ